MKVHFWLGRDGSNQDTIQRDLWATKAVKRILSDQSDRDGPPTDYLFLLNGKETRFFNQDNILMLLSHPDHPIHYNKNTCRLGESTCSQNTTDANDAKAALDLTEDHMTENDAKAALGLTEDHTTEYVAPVTIAEVFARITEQTGELVRMKAREQDILTRNNYLVEENRRLTRIIETWKFS